MQAFNFDSKLKIFFAAPNSTFAEINSFIHNPIFPPVLNLSFAILPLEKRCMQIITWVDELPETRKIAKEMEKKK